MLTPKMGGADGLPEKLLLQNPNHPNLEFYLVDPSKKGLCGPQSKGTKTHYNAV